MSAQPMLDLAGDTDREPREGIADLPASKGEISRTDSMPPGPYGVGMTHTQRGDEWPYTITCGDGRAIAGHVNSRACAQAIADVLNREFPA